ncbi:hypothetical protein AVEN_108097-1 [Araneus ventricosus]|uniref:Uncharacterized protein n=1 Tax=Araneus ventricosus TaxID=182803 RepID=A0A4Y2H566_ARAVE|nr:hypothetical protein AVEN_108097-1 [Araneus ventricosus]
MENAVVIPTWNMLKKEDLQNVLGLHSCSIIPRGLLFVMQICTVSNVDMYEFHIQAFSEHTKACGLLNGFHFSQPWQIGRRSDVLDV